MFSFQESWTSFCNHVFVHTSQTPFKEIVVPIAWMDSYRYSNTGKTFTVHSHCNVTMTLWDRDATTLFSFIQSITHSFIRYTQHTAVMSAIFDFSSLITVFVLSICTTTYLRELRPAIFDTSIPSMAGGDGGGRTPSAAGSFQSDDATTTNAANNNQSLSPQQRQQAHHHREGIMGFLWKLSRIGERCSPYISIACILQALNILFWK